MRSPGFRVTGFGVMGFGLAVRVTPPHQSRRGAEAAVGELNPSHLDEL
jgi:hypothetical protein